MKEFFIYEGKVALLLVAFYLLFKVLLSRETFHRLNRVILLGTSLLAFVLPFCVITYTREVSAAEACRLLTSISIEAMPPELLLSGPTIWPWLMLVWGLGALAVLMAGLIALFAAPMVSLFGLKDPLVAAASVTMVRLFAIRVAFRLFNVIFMSTLRAGGDSLFLMFLDCGVLWLVGVPLAFLGVHLGAPLWGVALCVYCDDIAKVAVGFVHLFRETWVKNVTAQIQEG